MTAAVRVLPFDVKPITMKLPPPMYEGVRLAAAANFETPSAYMRRVILERLRADGFLPDATTGSG